MTLPKVFSILILMKVSTIQIYQLEEKRAILHSIQAYHVYVSINISKNFNIFSTAYYLNILITFRRSAKNTSGIRIYIHILMYLNIIYVLIFYIIWVRRARILDHTIHIFVRIHLRIIWHTNILIIIQHTKYIQHVGCGWIVYDLLLHHRLYVGLNLGYLLLRSIYESANNFSSLTCYSIT